jgi:hypothetical protein
MFKEYQTIDCLQVDELDYSANRFDESDMLCRILEDIAVVNEATIRMIETDWQDIR